MQRFQITITDEAFEFLAQLAHTERRSVKDQAAFLLEKVISEKARSFGIPSSTATAVRAIAGETTSRSDA